MRSRTEAARFVNDQLRGRIQTQRPKGDEGDPYPAGHYGCQELRDLLDFIYDGPPRDEDEEIAPYTQ